MEMTDKQERSFKHQRKQNLEACIRVKEQSPVAGWLEHVSLRRQVDHRTGRQGSSNGDPTPLRTEGQGAGE